MKRLLANWKTTLNGVLGFFIAMGCILQALNSPLVSIRFNAGLTMALALARGVVAFLQKDAGTTAAVLPGSVGVQLVDSHETPNDPAAVVVKGVK